MMLFTAINQNMKEPISCSLLLEVVSMRSLLLLAVCKESLQHDTLPPTLTRTSISLLKNNKDTNLCILETSLLNDVNAKIIAKAFGTLFHRSKLDLLRGGNYFFISVQS